MRRITGQAIVLSAIVFAAALVFFGSTLLEAVRVEDRGAMVDASAVSGDARSGESAADRRRTPDVTSLSVDPKPSPFSEAAAPVVTLEEILSAVEGDPFLPDRRAPAQRYQLPGERSAGFSEPETEPLPAPALRIVGTAVIGQGGIALVQFEENPVVAVSMGEYVEGYRLAAIGPERATLVGAAGRLVLPVMEPLRVSERPSRGRDANRTAEQAARAVSEQLQELLRAQRGNLFNRGTGGRGGFPGGRGGRGGRGGGDGGGPDGPPAASP